MARLESTLTFWRTCCQLGCALPVSCVGFISGFVGGYCWLVLVSDLERLLRAMTTTTIIMTTIINTITIAVYGMGNDDDCGIALFPEESVLTRKAS
jgi:hypothetical protein